MRTGSTPFHPVRRDRLMQAARHDTYMVKHKLPEPTVCPDCGAVYHAGRWQWLSRPPKAHEKACPACHRIQDDFPAGYVNVGGAFFRAHRDEIMRLVHNAAAREKSEHPLKRIMKVEALDGSALITTTDIHLARGIGEALRHAYQGELEYHYNDQENLLRVVWTR